MSSNVKLRLAQRSDIPALARITNDAQRISAIHKRMSPYQDKYPLDYYRWRLNIVRGRFATPELRTIVAEDSTTGEVLGLACWDVTAKDTALYKRWVSESTWADWLEGKLVDLEKTWYRWVGHRSLDFNFFSDFMAAFQGGDSSRRPACLHLQLISVDPGIQSKGVGSALIDWGKDLAVNEGLPIYLESNLEATGFYEKGGFSRMNKEMVIGADTSDPMHVPVYVWEGKERAGRWLEQDVDFEGVDVRWKWKDAVLSK